jgi:hypothetical protein
MMQADEVRKLKPRYEDVSRPLRAKEVHTSIYLWRHSAPLVRQARKAPPWSQWPNACLLECADVLFPPNLKTGFEPSLIPRDVKPAVWSIASKRTHRGASSLESRVRY